MEWRAARGGPREKAALDEARRRQDELLAFLTATEDREKEKHWVGAAACRAERMAAAERFADENGVSMRARAHLLRAARLLPARRRPRLDGWYTYSARSGDDFIKVGYTGDLRQRLTDLQIGNPRRIYFVHLRQFVGKSDAMEMERRLLYALTRQATGEWFEATADNLWLLDFHLGSQLNAGDPGRKGFAE